ncbi:hypothetical protein ACO2Q3_04825 [Caulobacter sp. KR2-114]|uniref:hypothetical protein n=1 Tax=Caulobacter sp. KR2-114 TaxID=3400912 RepID=UPI003C021A46
MPQPVNAAVRRYYLRFGVAMGLYAAALVAAIELLRVVPAGSPARYALAVAPALPLVGVIVAIGRYLVEEADEFRRMLLVQSMLWGLAALLTITTVWGFLELFAGAPRLQLFLVFPIFCAGMGVSQALLFRRYR